jgi:DNA-binding PadR family transcriptional regulator
MYAHIYRITICLSVDIDVQFSTVYILLSTDNRVRKQTLSASFLPLKPHWFHVLLSLSHQDQHGYGIMQDVLERTGGKVRLWPPTLYGTIKRLIDADLIQASNKKPDADDDARRRYYVLTNLGRSVLAAECERLEDLVRSVHAKRGLKPRSVE